MFESWFSDFPQVWWVGLVLTSLTTYWVMGRGLYDKIQKKEKIDWRQELFNLAMSGPVLWYMWPMMAGIILVYFGIEYCYIRAEEDESKRNSGSDN